jgi:F0F1-type ATP synthase gamma subunit
MFFNFMKPKKDHSEAANTIVATAIAKIAEKDTKETILVLRGLVNAAFDHIESMVVTPAAEPATETQEKEPEASEVTASATAPAAEPAAKPQEPATVPEPVTTPVAKKKPNT